MNGKLRACVISLCGAVQLCVTDLYAQSPVWLASIHYESPTLAAPVVMLYLPSEKDGTVSFGILGWTLSAGWSKNVNPAVSFGISAEITPIHSHSSNSIYRNGIEVDSLEYSNRTAQIRSGITIRHGKGWDTELALIGLYESVDGLHDNTVSRYWKNPYAGIEVRETFSAKGSEEPLRSRFDGISCSGKAQMFVGARTWWRTELTVAAGKKLGAVFIRGNGSYLLGNSLNTVNQFLTGGSWDILSSTAVYGYHYAEFRVSKGVLVNIGADIGIGNGVDVGFRAGYLNSPGNISFGESAVVSFVWGGADIHAGAGSPDHGLFRGDLSSGVIFAGMTAALFTP
jgi:hypothetical protein